FLLQWLLFFLLICLLFLLVCFLIHSNAIIFDPRYKMGYIEWAFGELYGEGSTRFRTEIKIVEEELAALYDKCVAQDKRAGNGESSSSSANIPSIPVQAGYESFLSSRSTRISKSDLRNYLEDEVAPRNKALDLLGWWKDNAPRYPIMAKIARRFLTIPATSVSSESTFSTTGRILDDYRSSLKPVMVEALVCGASYIKGAHVDLNLVVCLPSFPYLFFLSFLVLLYMM
uniref:HAT C-terminal dimerisation domain-containing protein n=1 Tax=Aegilops tauschii subsp. strangulata TaxID=200361 RepID=A0A453G831_AEGTS